MCMAGTVSRPAHWKVKERENRSAGPLVAVGLVLEPPAGGRCQRGEVDTDGDEKLAGGLVAGGEGEEQVAGRGEPGAGGAGPTLWKGAESSSASHSCAGFFSRTCPRTG